MINFFALSDLLATLLLRILPRRIATRIRQNISPVPIYILSRNAVESPDEPRMTLFEGVFATLLFDMALFGTSNGFINWIISIFTSIQNSWDTPFKNSAQAEEKVMEFCDRLHIQTEPWIWEKEASEYTSLNDFFSRTYASKYLPPIQEGRLVSPACCKILSFPNDDAMRTILIKGCDYRLDRIGLYPPEDLERYCSNRVFLGYLSPKDYHRVHAPIKGKCIHCNLEGADRRSASVKFFGGKFNILNENKRLVIVLEEENSNNGVPLRVALVIVGGVGVDTITYDLEMVGRVLEKGQEVSAFRAGGSAFALFSNQPLGVVEPVKIAEGCGMHLQCLVGETLVC